MASGTEVSISNDPDDDQELVLEVEAEEQWEATRGNKDTYRDLGKVPKRNANIHDERN